MNQPTSLLPMLLRTRAPTPSDCSTLKTTFSTFLAFIVLKKKGKITHTNIQQSNLLNDIIMNEKLEIVIPVPNEYTVGCIKNKRGKVYSPLLEE